MSERGFLARRRICSLCGRAFCGASSTCSRSCRNGNYRLEHCRATGFCHNCGCRVDENKIFCGPFCETHEMPAASKPPGQKIRRALRTGKLKLPKNWSVNDLVVQDFLSKKNGFCIAAECKFPIILEMMKNDHNDTTIIASTGVSSATLNRIARRNGFASSRNRHGAVDFAKRSGWPIDLHAGEIAILNVLAAIGIPCKAIDLAEIIRSKRSVSHAVKNLLRRDLVVKIKNFSAGLVYTLAPLALSLIEDRATCERIANAQLLAELPR